MVSSRSGFAVEVVFGTGDEHEGEGQSAGCFGCRGDALDGVVEVVDRVAALLVASSIEPPTRPASAARRIVSAAAWGESPYPFSRSAATGRWVASTMAFALARASSRVMLAVPIATAEGDGQASACG